MTKAVKSTKAEPMPPEAIAGRIVTLRRQQVIIDADLADLYGVKTKRLNEQVKRNAARFPADFLFRLTSEETEELNRSQIATGSQKHRDPRSPPYAFTEHGALMAASVLNTPKAIEVSVYVIRAFVKLRELLMTNKDLAQRMSRAEQRLSGHDLTIGGVVQAMRQLSSSPAPAKKRSIGFVRPKDE